MRSINNRHLSDIEAEIVGHSTDVIDATLLFVLNDVNSTLRI